MACKKNRCCKKDTVKEVEEKMEPLGTEILDKVSGAGDPFEDVPRIPVEDIDENLRKDG